MEEYTKPLPLITKLSKPFYDACKEKRLIYQLCTDCEQVIFFPKFLCPNCMSRNLEWKDSKGKGKILTYTVTYDYGPQEFMQDGPYALALIDLDEGYRMMSNIVDCEFDDIHCDMPVEVVFDPVTPEITLPKFRPLKGA